LALTCAGKLELRRDYPEPSPAAGEALIRMLTAGICATDIEIVKGYMSFSGVLGHEFVGIVEQASDPALKGRRVVGEINLPCGRCEFCLRGQAKHCPGRTVLGIKGKDGAFAEYLTLPCDKLHRLPDGVSDVEAVFVEPLAAALEVLEAAEEAGAEEALVFGDGKLGTLVAQVLSTRDGPLKVIGKHEQKLRILRERGIDASSGRGDEKSRFVADCTGNPRGFERALASVIPGGTLVTKTTCVGQPRLDLSRVVVDELKIVGSRCGDFERAIHFLEQNLVEVAPLVTSHSDLSDSLEAFRKAMQPESMKVLIWNR